ncbi:biotin/lipoyl-containing protein [Psychroflexus planctonicus]|uniref:Acetyl-CoA carboxylase biotin carboxyl carrier protein subunit n=1 Tax=Psychroflexus planctonicus TaxID=1526575 RepID=A0ABQ1SJR4_9FLAO|nr:acetyl-CoA carboxylase biotin carboxyl carrier protein subunit [Psychroflexus planctonicus]GGE43463.1 acetyl-CoA carboxylase biotin carboxyl carrier protein subunit [Psychroflexus planctonicus]
MSKLYKAKVNDEFEFEFTQEEIDKVDSFSPTSKQIHILHENQSVTTEVIQQNFNQQAYQIKVNSNIYKVQISNDLDVLIKEMGLSLAASSQINEIKAPMPGLILDIKVEEGQEVKEGETLLILEAMKMENSITAPRDAVIKKVPITQGNTVAKNELLIEME